jgi:hypothetical protein
MLHEQIAKSMAHDKNKFDYSSMARHLTIFTQSGFMERYAWELNVK